MAFADKKGINIASPFKLQAEELLDVRQEVDTIVERDELVRIHAAAPGLRVFVKANKTTYIYNGSGWDTLISSANIGSQSVTTATKLSSSAGSATQPIYFSNGKPAACSYTLGKSVPSNAVFTDTTYRDMKGATTTGVGVSGLVPAPSPGAANRYLRSDGSWQVPPDTNTTYTLSSFDIAVTADDINKLKGIKGNVQEYIDRIFAKADHIDSIKLNLTGGKLTGDLGIPKEPCELADGGVPYAGSSGYLSKWEDITKYKTYLGSLAVGGSDLANWNHLISIRHYNGHKTSASSGFYLYTSYSTDNGLTFRKQKDQTSWYNERVLLDSANYSSYVASASHSHSTATTSAAGFMPKLNGSTSNYLRGDGSWATPPNTNTDTKVTQTAVAVADYTNWRSIPWGSSNSASEGFTPTTVTDVTYTTPNLSFQPSTGTLKATVFKGNLSGNATSADSANYATSAGSASSATTATKLSSSAGSATQPVYFSGGKPVACSYTLGKSVPSNAVFTDTNTWIAFKGATTSAAGTAGYAPAPSAGAANRYLRSDGTWSVPPNDNTTYSLSSFGITASAAEINYTKGVTSSIQTQLNGKASSSHTHDLSAMINSLSTGSSTPVDGDYYVTQYAGGGTTNTEYLRRPVSALATYVNSKLATVARTGSYNDLSGRPSIPSVGNGTVTITQNGTKKGSFTMNQSGDATIALTDTNTTYSLGSFGITASAAEINYTKGVTSSIQTQLNGKAASSHSHSTASTSSAGFMPKLNGSTSNYLRGDGSWATPPNTNTDTKVTNTPANTSTAYITGTTSSSANTGTQIFDTGVYLTSTSGRMHTGSLEIGGAILTYDSTNKSLTISFS